MTLTDEQKSAAIAVIFYAGGDSKLGERVLGVGIKNTTGETPSGYAVDLKDSSDCIEFPSLFCYKRFSTDDVTKGNYYPYDKGTSTTYYADTTDFDGSDNWSVIAAIDNNIDNYPAFKWARDYGNNHSLTGTKYESGWYLPCWAELYNICAKTSTLNECMQAVGGTTFPTSGMWWTSNTYNNTGVDFQWESCDFGTMSYRNSEYKICAIHKF